MQIKFYPCISPWSRGSHLLFSCQTFFVRMQDVFFELAPIQVTILSILN